jgi:hypothetical protein
MLERRLLRLFPTNPCVCNEDVHYFAALSELSRIITKKDLYEARIVGLTSVRAYAHLSYRLTEVKCEDYETKVSMKL